MTDSGQSVAGELVIEGGNKVESVPLDASMSVRVKGGRPELVLVLGPMTTWVISAEPAAMAYIAGALAARSGVRI